jgi:hypothetical protein
MGNNQNSKEYENNSKQNFNVKNFIIFLKIKIKIFIQKHILLLTSLIL